MKPARRRSIKEIFSKRFFVFSLPEWGTLSKRLNVNNGSSVLLGKDFRPVCDMSGRGCDFRCSGTLVLYFLISCCELLCFYCCCSFLFCWFVVLMPTFLLFWFLLTVVFCLFYEHSSYKTFSPVSITIYGLEILKTMKLKNDSGS